MKPDRRKELEDAVASVDNMFLKDELSSDAYFKCLVVISYDYMQEGDLHESLRLLRQCPANYLAEQLPIQMSKDSSFGEIIQKMIEFLAKSRDVAELINGPKARGSN